MYGHRGGSIRKYPEKPVGKIPGPTGKSPGTGVQDTLRKAFKIRGYIQGERPKPALTIDAKFPKG